MTITAPNQQQLEQTHEHIRTWYDTYGRKSLPWRNTTDPYAIYLSEVMLQQTQVQTVLNRFYHPFLERFPTLTALAEATYEEVLEKWQGLGYYTRAKHLHHSAQQVAPKLPETVDELYALPGIGKNTAHAIAAFAYHQPVAIMEANVKRILHRLAAKETLSTNELWGYAGQLVDKKHPFIYNQAMMDIGSTICTPKTPQCLLCPLSTLCEGKTSPEAFPAKKKKKAQPVRKRHIVVFIDANEKYYMTPRTTRFLYQLYGFPEYDATLSEVKFMGENYPIEDLRFLGNITQIYSHFTLDASVYLHTLPYSANSLNWKEWEHLQTLPMSAADQKVITQLEHSQKKVLDLAAQAV